MGKGNKTLKDSILVIKYEHAPSFHSDFEYLEILMNFSMVPYETFNKITVYLLVKHLKIK